MTDVQVRGAINIGRTADHNVFIYLPAPPPEIELRSVTLQFTPDEIDNLTKMLKLHATLARREAKLDRKKPTTQLTDGKVIDARL